MRNVRNIPQESMATNIADDSVPFRDGVVLNQDKPPPHIPPTFVVPGRGNAR